MRNGYLSLSLRTWSLILAAWLLWALLSAVELASRMWWLKTPYHFTDALRTQLPLALALAATTPGILTLSRRFPLLDATRTRRWDVHVVGCLALVVMVDALSCAQSSVLSNTPFDLGSPKQYASRVLGLWFLPIGLLYWFIVAIDHGIRHFIAARDQTEARARLEAQVANSRLEALKLQLHPHFLFNALHSIGTLVRTGRSQDAVRVTAGLGELLRRLLNDAPVQEVTLREELAFIKDYLGIEMIRFSDRLHVDYDITSEAEDALVPHLLLQPLVENALRHGLQPLARGGGLTIFARNTGDALELRVSDDGVGIRAQENAPAGTGRGLANVRARLAELYGARQSLELRSRVGGGAEVRVTLPWRAGAAVLAGNHS